MSASIKIDNEVTLYYGRLGREIKVSPKSHVEIKDEGCTITCINGQSAVVDIAIGDHMGVLMLPIDAWHELNSGAEVTIRTSKEIKKTLFK